MIYTLEFFFPVKQLIDNTPAISENKNYKLSNSQIQLKNKRVNRKEKNNKEQTHKHGIGNRKE